MCKTGNVLLLFKWQTLMETPRFPETQEAGGEVNPQEPNHIFLQANTYYRPRTAALCGLRIGSNLKTSWARSCSFEWLLMLTILAVCFENFSELKVQDLKTCNCCCKSADAACLTGLRLAFFEASFWLMNCIWTHQLVGIKIQSLWSFGFDLMELDLQV